MLTWAHSSLPGDTSVNVGPLFSPRFYVTFVSTASYKYKEVHAASAEVLGMVLAFMEERQHVSGVCV